MRFGFAMGPFYSVRLLRRDGHRPMGDDRHNGGSTPGSDEIGVLVGRKKAR